MLQTAYTDLFNPLVPKSHKSECQNLTVPLQINPAVTKSSQSKSASLRIFCTLGPNGLRSYLQDSLTRNNPFTTGEHGQFTEKLVTAVQNGKCNNLSEGSPASPKGAAGGGATAGISLTNDIAKVQSEVQNTGVGAVRFILTVDQAELWHSGLFSTFYIAQWKMLFLHFILKFDLW